MKKASLLMTVLLISVLSTACINNFAVQELNNKAKAFLDKGDYENAISRLQSSVDLDSSIVETHYNLGIAYTEAEKYDEAILSFEKAIDLDPAQADSYYSLAIAQENFAKSLIDGSYYENKQSKNNDSQDDSITSDNDSDTVKKYEISNDDKKRITELFSDANDSYLKYLEKNTNAKDKAEVEEKISKLQEEIKKYQ